MQIYFHVCRNEFRTTRVKLCFIFLCGYSCRSCAYCNVLVSWSRWALTLWNTTVCWPGWVGPSAAGTAMEHDDVIKWKHFPHYWPLVQGIHRSPVNFPHKGQWHGALMFSLIYAWINGWVNNHEAGDLRCHRAHYDVIVMKQSVVFSCQCNDDIIAMIHVM